MSLECRIIEGLLARAECREFIERAESQGYLEMSGDYPATYRDNDRIVLDDQALADKLFRRFRAVLPQRVQRGGAEWHLQGLNSRFRGCRYRQGQSFTRHRDGAHSQGPRSRSFLTLMLYLNDHHQFEGGHTRFYLDRFSEQCVESVAPVAGTGIVFDHAYWHDGQAVTAGTKYVLRTDVMYRSDNEWAGHAGYVWCLSRLSDGRIASGSRDRSIKIWDGDSCQATLLGHQASICALAVVGSELWSGSRDRSIVVWSPQGQGFTKGRSWAAHDGAVLHLNEFPGVGVVSLGADNRVRLWGSDGRLVDQAETGRWPWCCIYLGGEVVIGCDDGSCWKWKPGGLCRQFAILQSGVTSLVAQGTQMIAGCADGALRTLGEGYSSQPRPGHRGPVTSLLSLPDGTLVSGSEDDGVRRWTNGTSHELVRHRDFVRALVLTGAGRTLVSASYDGSLVHTVLEP